MGKAVVPPTGDGLGGVGDDSIGHLHSEAPAALLSIDPRRKISWSLISISRISSAKADSFLLS